jgi:DNA-binding GntR family transcriptional regulator
MDCPYGRSMDTRTSTSSYTDTYTASALAYHELKSLILLGEVPIGVRIREERLAERLQMSRTPIREAMLRLFAEHFLERHAEGGFRAAIPSTQSMRELYEVRRALEVFALRRSGPDVVRDRSSVEELREEWRTIDSNAGLLDAEFVHLDEDFHRRLAESSGNVQLAEELRHVNERIRPIRTHDFMTPGRITTTIDQHLGILDSVLARKFGQAAMLLEVHIGESYVVVESAVTKMLERMATAAVRDQAW